MLRQFVVGELALSVCGEGASSVKEIRFIQSHEQRQVYCVGDMGVVPSLAGFDPGTTGFRTAYCATTLPGRYYGSQSVVRELAL